MFFRRRPKELSVATVPDEGAVHVVLEALGAAGLTPTVRRVPWNPYKPANTGTSFEIRVPPDQVDAANAALSALADEAGQELEAQALAAGRTGDGTDRDGR